MRVMCRPVRHHPRVVRVRHGLRLGLHLRAYQCSGRRIGRRRIQWDCLTHLVLRIRLDMDLLLLQDLLSLLRQMRRLLAVHPHSTVCDLLAFLQRC